MRRAEAEPRRDRNIRTEPTVFDHLRILLDKNYFVPDPLRADQYLHRDHSSNTSSGDVLIPIGKKEWVWMHYFGRVQGCTSDRPISCYQEMLFPDVFEETVYDPDNKEGYSIEHFLREQPRRQAPQPVFTGYEEAFGPGKVVLDIAAGECVAGMQLALSFPQATFFAVDILYQTTRKLYPNRPGLQLSHANWHYLETVPTASVDTILSCQGVLMWGIPKAPSKYTTGNGIPESDGVLIVQALNRVSKPGTVLRFDGYDMSEFLIEHLGSNWEIADNTDAFIARRKK